MLLAVDIGNTSIKFGFFDGDELISKFSIPTIRDATAEEIKLEVGDRLSSIDSAIVCSVVPQLEPSIRAFLSKVARIEPVFVDNSFDFGLKINYRPPESLGTDRLVNAFAAVEKYGAPMIVCSLGTATTIDVVNAHREFLGGIIAPGLDAMAEALHLRAPRLPRADGDTPDRVIANNTSGAVRSGVYFGYVEMVGGLIDRIQSESGVSPIVCTGGNAALVAAELDWSAVVDADLLMTGLRILAGR